MRNRKLTGTGQFSVQFFDANNPTRPNILSNACRHFTRRIFARHDAAFRQITLTTCLHFASPFISAWR